MGTRNLTMVIKDAQTKVAQYGQWDGYPDGQGITALSFLQSVDMDVFRKKLDSVQWVDESKQEEIDAFYKSIGVEGEWVNMEQSDKIKHRYPLFSRDNGAKILEMIMNCEDEKIFLYNNEDFANDSLANEWTYVIDLDKNTLEVYSGYNKSPLSESDRFFNNGEKDGEYYPVRLVKMWELNTLPTEEDFLKTFESVESE